MTPSMDFKPPEAVDGARFMAEAQSEHEFMRHVIAFAAKQGWLIYHTHIAKRSAEGFPDLTLVRNGRLVFAELKREKGGRYTPAQLAWLSALAVVAEKAGTVRELIGVDVVGVYRWTPSMWPEIELVLA